MQKKKRNIQYLGHVLTFVNDIEEMQEIERKIEKKLDTELF